jgi:hypothetical protein
MGYLTDFLIGIGGSLIAAEVCANADRVAAFFIRRAIQRVPETERERRLEEWLAHLDDTPGAVRKLFHGLGCWFGAPAVARALAKGRPVRAISSSSNIYRSAFLRVFANAAEEAGRLAAERTFRLARRHLFFLWSMILLSFCIGIAGFVATHYVLNIWVR